jgi:hypothetical protein
MTSTYIIKANGRPADYVDSIDRVRVLLDCHGEVGMLRIIRRRVGGMRHVRCVRHGCSEPPPGT